MKKIIKISGLLFLILSGAGKIQAQVQFNAGADLVNLLFRTLDLNGSARFADLVEVRAGAGLTFQKKNRNIDFVIGNFTSGSFVNASVRIYPKIFPNAPVRIFTGAGLFLSSWKHKYAVVIEHYYGTYADEQTIFGKTRGLSIPFGLSLEKFPVRYEMGVQFNFMSEREDDLLQRGYFTPGVGSSKMRSGSESNFWPFFRLIFIFGKQKPEAIPGRVN